MLRPIPSPVVVPQPHTRLYTLQTPLLRSPYRGNKVFATVVT